MKVTFLVYPDTSSKIEAVLDYDSHNKEITSVKLKTKIPRGQYYSVLNDACKEAENHIPVFRQDLVNYLFQNNQPEKATLAFLGFFSR